MPTNVALLLALLPRALSTLTLLPLEVQKVEVRGVRVQGVRVQQKGKRKCEHAGARLTDWHLVAACWLHKRAERCRKLAAWESTLRDLCSTSCQMPGLLCSGSSPALSRNSRVSSWLSNHMAWASSATPRVSGFALGPAATRLIGF